MKKALVIISIISLVAIVLCVSIVETETSLGTVNMISQADYARLVEARQAVTEPLLLDAVFDEHSLPKGIDTDFLFPAFDESIQLRYRRGYDVAFLPNDPAQGGGASLILYNSAQYRVYSFCFTKLPILDILLPKTASADQPIDDYIWWNGGDDWEGRAIFYEQDEQNGGVLAETWPMKIKRRGNFSRTYPKSSYTLMPSEVYLNSVDSGVLGLPKNNRYALTALYGDDSKIRTLSGMRLWSALDSSVHATADRLGVDGKTIELCINGRYWGVYALSETLNEYSIHCNPGDVIYKIKSETLTAKRNSKSQWQELADIHLVYTDAEKEYGERLFEEFFNVLYYSDDDTFRNGILRYYDEANIVDYYIFTELLFACDNVWNNGVLTYRADSGKFHIAPWDLDLTLGSFWTTVPPTHTRRMQVDLTDHVYILSDDGASLLHRLWALNPDGFRRTVATRWFSLREGLLSEENLLGFIDAMFDELTDSGVRLREAKRWPESAYVEDNAFIRDFLSFRLGFLDECYANEL